MRIEDIHARLKEIQTLKNIIAKRVWAKALPVADEMGETLTQAAIKQRVELLAQQLMNDHPDANPVLVSLMDGALPFASLLQTALNERGYQYSYTTMQASSYGNKMHSGDLKIGSMPKILLGGRTVFVVDDVCDTGNTYLKIRELLASLGAQTVSLVALVDKVQPRIGDYTPEYFGFQLPADAFIVGMGLDYRSELRNEPEIRGVDLSSLPTIEEEAILNSEALLNEQLRQLIALEKESKPGSSVLTVFGKKPKSPRELDLMNNQPISAASI